MKKIVSLALALLVLMSTVVLTASASTIKDGKSNCPSCGKYYPVTYVEPSCTKAAHYRIFCTDCRKNYEFKFDETKPALGHDEAVEVVKATCMERGYDRHYCKRFGETFYRENVVEPYGHDYVQYERDPSWAKDECRYKKICKRCGYDGSMIYPGGHAHINEDNKCVRCNFDFETECGHFCHKDGFLGFIYKIARVFLAIFKTNEYCECGKLHW